MAKHRGWWYFRLEGNSHEELEQWDLDHIAKLIKEGYTNGEVCKDD